MKMVVFDLDGTLVNSLTDLALSVNKGLRAVGLESQPIERYRHFVGNGREKLVYRAIAASGGSEAQFEAVRDVFDREYRDHCNDNTAAYSGCAQMLSNLAERGVMTAVLSNKPDEFVPEILKKLYPDHTFTEAWGQKPQYRTKPDPQALHAMLSLHGLATEDCVYVGDSDVDVFTARNAGVKLAGVSWGFRGREELISAGAPFVADTAKELENYLLSL